MVDKAVRQGGGHLGVAEYTGPLAEVGGDTDGGTVRRVDNKEAVANIAAWLKDHEKPGPIESIAVRRAIVGS